MRRRRDPWPGVLVRPVVSGVRGQGRAARGGTVMSTTTQLRRRDDGNYESLDGRFVVSRETATTMCENPHPMGRGGYCDGGEDHDYDFWLVTSNDDEEAQLFDGDTLRECRIWIGGQT